MSDPRNRRGTAPKDYHMCPTCLAELKPKERCPEHNLPAVSAVEYYAGLREARARRNNRPTDEHTTHVMPQDPRTF
jgi:hypothetical protein